MTPNPSVQMQNPFQWNIQIPLTTVTFQPSGKTIQFVFMDLVKERDRIISQVEQEENKTNWSYLELFDKYIQEKYQVQLNADELETLWRNTLEVYLEEKKSHITRVNCLGTIPD